MSFRFWQRIRLAPWVTLNLSKSSASLSFGPPGAKYTIGPSGHRVTAGLPGSGLFYTVHTPHERTAAPSRPAAPSVRERLDLGFLRRLFMPASERSFADGLLALHDGDEAAALSAWERTPQLADAAWLAGMLRLKREDLPAARRHLEAALAGSAQLGRHVDEFGLALAVSFPVAPDVVAHARAGEYGARLALVEVAQADGQRSDALVHLERLLLLAPQDPVVQVSFAELLLAPGPSAHVGDRPAGQNLPAVEPALLQRIVAITAGVENETPVHTALLWYRGCALVRLGLDAAALEVFTQALRRRADRPPTLLHQIRHERALLHERQERHAQARRDFERLYAEAPEFPGVKRRLGLG